MIATDDLFRLFADPTRRAVFEHLVDSGELTVGELTSASRVTQSAVSQHLTLLREAGLVTGVKAGRNVRYRAEVPALAPLVDWMGHYCAAWPEAFDRLETLLKEMDQ